MDVLSNFHKKKTIDDLNTRVKLINYNISTISISGTELIFTDYLTVNRLYNINLLNENGIAMGTLFITERLGSYILATDRPASISGYPYDKNNKLTYTSTNISSISAFNYIKL